MLERLGTGGMGTVYLAEHITLARKLAIKVLKEEVSENPEYVARFLREARAASAIDHPNVIEVVDTGTLPNGSAYYVMEYLQGEDLSRTLRREGRLPWSRVRHIALQLCDALAAAHARGIVHRDLKPANCLRLDRDGDPDRIKILDFGIAKLLDSHTHALTGTGEMIGTAAYMAPEQAIGGPIDHRVDIYALGVMLYLLLTGVHPYSGRTTVETLYALLHRTPQSVRAAAPDADVPEAVEAVVARAMHRDLAERFASMRELAAALTAIPAGDPTYAARITEEQEQPADTTEPIRRPTNVADSRVFAATAPAHPTPATPPATSVELAAPAPEPAPSPALETMSQRPTTPTFNYLLLIPLGLLIAGAAYLAWSRQDSPETAASAQIASREPTTPTPTPEVPPPTQRPQQLQQPQQVEPTPPAPEPPSVDPAPPPRKTEPAPKPPTPTPKPTPKPPKDIETQLRAVVKKAQQRCHSSLTEETLRLGIHIDASTGSYTRLNVLPPHTYDSAGTCITGILRDKKNAIRPTDGADFARDSYPITLKPKR